MTPYNRATIAKCAGISEPHLSNIFRYKRTPSYKLAKTLSNLYGFPLTYFIEPDAADFEIINERVRWVKNLLKKAEIDATVFLEAMKTNTKLPHPEAQRLTRTMICGLDVWEKPAQDAIEYIEEARLEKPFR